jgi:predicted DNA-binding transcriptional regulator YafY
MRGAAKARHSVVMLGELQARRARQFMIVLLLRARGKVRAQELAAALGVSARTIARDCAELELIGVPVIAERGAAGGFRLAQPMPLDPARFVAPATVREPHGEPRADVGSAAGHAEVERLRIGVRGLVERMDEVVRTEAEAALAQLRLGTLPGAAGAMHEVLLTLRRALWQGRRVRLDYPTDGEPHTRDVDPLVLVARDSVWYLCGFCHWRQDVRTFVVSRITLAQALDDVAPVAQQMHVARDDVAG